MPRAAASLLPQDDATKPRAGAREKRLASKKQRSAVKALRSGGRRGEEP